MNNDNNIDSNNTNETDENVVNAANNNSNKKTSKKKASNILNDVRSLSSKDSFSNNKFKDKSSNVQRKSNQTPKVGNNNIQSGQNLKKPNNGVKDLQQQNNGRNLINGMKNSAKPSDEKAERRQKRMNRAIQLAKHIPVPQVKAVAEVADKANKGKNAAGKTLGKSNKSSSLNDSSDKSEKSGFSGLLKLILYRKIILFSIPVLFFLIVIFGVFSAFSAKVSASASEMNEGLCVADYDVPEGVNDKCEETSEEAKNFHKRVKEVKEEYSENGKEFDALYIVGFYVTIEQTSKTDITYDSMTKDKIKSIADAMFEKEDESYTFDEDTFRKNLIKKVLPEYIPGENKSYYDYLATQIFEYVDRYREMYGTKDSDDSGDYDSDMANRLVEVAQHEFDTYKEGSRGAKYRNWLHPDWGYFAWCATFVSWCANKAGIPTSVITHSASVDSFITQARKQNADHKPSSGYKPKPGDLVIWKQSLYSNSRFESHIGIVKSYNAKNKKLVTLEGNSSDAVRQNTYNGIGDVGMFFSPKYPASSGTSTGTIKNGQSIKIPQNFKQSMYTITGYDYWIKSGRPMVWTAGTDQRRVSDLWKKKGSKFENGIATIDGRYLIAVCETFGETGEKVDVYLSNGKVLPCIIADAKSQEDKNITKWGHMSDDGSINVVEFEVKRATYYKYHANPSNGGWNNSWHHKAVKIVNGGSIFKKK